ncbi:beta strand repeat-containing protein, partial [Methanosphaera sp.]|uniref:beta strand repeat-containing protein n=2 Tax=Methanosphaera sp. TaxID=2666342 RepID=UPI002E794416
MDIKMKGCLVFLVLLFITIGAVSATDVSDDSTVVADDVPTAYSTEEAISYETSTSSDNSPDTRTTINDNSVVTVGDNEVIDGNGSTFTNTSFKVTGNNVVLSNFCVDNNDFASSVIDATGVNNLTIANVCLTTTNTDGITFGIDFTNTTNSIIRDSTITVNAPSQAQIWKNDTGYWYSTLPVSAILMDGSQNIAVTQNTIGITNTTESYQGTTMPAVTVKNNAQNINITNNDISASGANYVYGVMMNDVVSNVKVLNNNVTVTGPLYVAGIDASTSTQSTISDNKIVVSSSNPTGIYYNGTESLAYGVILATYTAGNSQNTVNGNNITLDGNVAYGIENIYGTDNNINNNQITITAKRGLGIATHTSNNNHYDNNNIVINCNQDSINNFYEMVTPTNVGIIILNSTDNQINNNYIKINETSTTNTTYAIILDENTTRNTGSNNELYVYNTNGLIKSGENAILNEGNRNNIQVTNYQLKSLSKKYSQYLKSDSDEIVWTIVDKETTGTQTVINLSSNSYVNQYVLFDLKDTSVNRIHWLTPTNVVIKIINANNFYGIRLNKGNSTIVDSYLPNAVLGVGRADVEIKDSTFLDFDYYNPSTGTITFNNTTFLAINKTLSYPLSGSDQYLNNKLYTDFFDESTNILLDSVDVDSIIVRDTTIEGTFTQPMIINKPINITSFNNATWNGDITFVSGSEGSNLTDMILNGTVYINTTNIGLYNNTINKGVVLTDSSQSIIEDNTFNTEDVAITLVNTIQTNIQNNDITSQAEYAIALDGDSIENTITKNIIYSADKEGNDAVNGDTTTNTISANKPGPVIFTLTDSTWSEFFNDDGTAKDIVEAGAELRFDGVFNNRDMVISVPLNLTTAETQAVLNNCSFFIDADGVNVTNIQMNADDIEGSLIYVEDAEDTRIENNTLTLTNNGEKLVTHTINVIESSNVIIRNNTITTTGPEEDVVYDGFQTTLVYTTSINSELTDSITIDNNNIKTKGNGKSTETGTIYGVYVSGEYIYDDEYYVNDIAITNNNITTEADAYAYSIDLGHADVALVENNTLTSTGKKYAGGIQGYNVDNTVITNNILKITSDNLGYGINVNGFFYMDDDWNMDTLVVEENIISNNEINITANDAWAVEIVIGDDNTVEYNNITIEASNGVGVGIADCNATIIENNNINIAATQENAMNTGDSIDSYTTGVKITACKVGIKTPHKNNVTSNNITINAVNNDVAAVNVTSDDNIITDNYLLSPAGRGDKAVSDTGEDNTIENNIPDYRLTDDTYSFYFDENGILKEEYNNTEIPIYGDFTENTQFIFEGVNVTIKADEFAT